MTIENPAPADVQAEHDDESAGFRYGVVFLLTLILVVFVIAAPPANWSRALALAIQGAALIVAVTTAREQRQAVRRRQAIGVGVAMVIMVVGVAAGWFPKTVSGSVNALATAAIPVVISRGVVRLMRDRGVTLQAVAGALAIYLSIGLVYAWIIGLIVQIDPSTAYFAQHTSQGANGSEGDRVYYSFTVLTTTGFGDFAAATPVGHALAVIEMLNGQLYLVTVIGLLIGNFVGAQRAKPRPD